MVSVEKTELKGERARRWPGGYRAGLRFERSGFETWLESMCSVHGHSTLLYPQTRVAVKCPCNPKKFAWGLNTGILFRRSSNVLSHKRKKSVEVATVNSY